MELLAKIKSASAYVNGKWVGALSGKVYNVLNPSTGEVIAPVPDLGVADAKAAIETAHKTFQSWKNTTARDRSKILRKWYDLCIENKKQIATLITLENGKSLSDAETETLYSADFLEWFSEECRRVYGDVIPAPVPNKRVLVVRQPIGVAGMITPWNFPSAMLTRKAGAAIAAGCTVVLKPSEDTPLSALALCQLAEEAGLPPGVLNVITSDRDNAPAIGKELCENPSVSIISFTGSTHVGKILLSQSASTVKKMSLELGGNAPFIVFDSADVEKAVKGFVACKFRCSGQTCVSANRILVQEGIYDRFIDALAREMNSQLKVGDGMSPGTTQGPLINRRAMDKVDSLVQDAVGKGARLVTGGTQDEAGDNFYKPTLLANVTTGMRIANEEIFGPVAPALKFKTEEEALTLANATSYGLASYFFTSDISQAWRVAEKLNCGLVGVNEGLLSNVGTTFSGWKESGLGSEGGKYGVDEYLEKKSICIGVQQ